MLIVKNLSLSTLFSNISFEIEKGIIGILGPSGSGKTTFLKTLGGFIKGYTGKIIYRQNNDIFKIKQGKIIKENKKNLTTIDISYKKSKIPLGFHFQDYNLIDLDVKVNINLPFIISGYKKDIKWIDYLVNYFEIEHLLSKDINKISQGEKERVSIVKSLANKPKLLLLDEAGASLDDRLKIKLYNFLKDYGKENIIIFISHDKEIIKKFNLNKVIYNKNFSIIKS